MISAAMFIPPDIPWDGSYARRCHAHVTRRDYHLVAILRTWDQLDQVVREHGVEVVVFAAPARRPIDIGNDTTRILRRRNDAANRHRPPAAGVLGEAERIIDQATVMELEIAAYQAGYEDGFVDSITRRRPPDEGD
jgi:hypothetical protein